MDPEIIKLREQNENLRKIIAFQNNSTENIFIQLSENIDDVFWLRTDNEIIYINPAFEKVWGIPCNEIYQNPQIFINSIHPEDKENVLANLNSDSFKKSGIFEYEYRIIRPDNQVRWIHAKSLPVINDQGEINRRVGVARDFTEQKKSQEESVLLAEMLDIAPNSITIHDQTGAFLYANLKTFEIHGYTREEFMALNLFSLDVPTSAELIEERIKAIQKTGQATFEVEHFKKNGEIISLEVFVKLVDWKGVPSMLSVATDMSERKKTEQALKKSEEKFRTFVENANDIIYQLNPEGIFTYASPNWTEKLGYNLEEVIGQKIEKFSHPDDLNHCIDFLNKVLIAGENQSGIEYRVRHKNGTWRWHNSTGAYIKDENNNTISYLGVARDITDKKLQEKATIELNQRYHTILKNFPNGVIFLFDKNLKYIHVEGKVLKDVGLESTKMIGKTVKEVFPNEVSEIAYPNQMLLFEGKTCYYEVEFAGNIYANWGVPIINNENKIEEGIIFALDITEKTKAQQNLLLSETKYKAAFHTSPDSVNINKINGEYLEINEGFTRLTGFTKEDVIGKLSSEINIWAIPADREILIKGLKQNGLVENLESVFRAKDGTLIHALMSAKIIMLNNEPHILSVTREITDRKKYEQQIIQQNEEYEALNEELRQTNEELHSARQIAEESAEKYRLLHENAGLGIGYYTQNGDIISFNMVAANYLNEKPEYFTDKSVFDIFPPDIAEIYYERIKNATLADTPTFYEDLVELPKVNKWFLSTFTKIVNSKNEITGVQVISQDITERKEIENKNRLLTSIIEKSQDFIGLATSDQRAFYVNPAGREIIGLENEEMVRTTKIEEYFFPEDLPFLNNTIIPQLMSTGRWVGEFRFRNFKTGKPIEVYYDLFLTENPLTKQVINLATISRDISFQQEMERNIIKEKEKAEKSEEKFRKAILTNPDAITINRLEDGVYLSANNGFYKTFEYPEYEIIGLSSIEINIWHNNEQREQYKSQLQENGTIENFEAKFVTKKGRILDCLVSASVFILEGKKHAISVTKDISYLKKIEYDLIIAKEKAETSEQHFKSLIENAPDGVVVIDQSGKFVYGSPNASRHFGYNENEVIGHCGDEYTHPDDLPLVVKAIETIINNPLQKPKVQYRFKRKNGEYRWIETTFTNLISDKAINGIILNFTDVTERKQILEDLIIAKEKAEESDQLKTAFLQNMSHEIRTPMNAIMGFSELLLHNLDNKEKLKKFTSIINQRCSDLLVIINDILDIAKIESGQMQFNEEKVNISILLQELVTIFNEQKLRLNKSNISIVYNKLNHSPDLIIITDRSRLIQIFTNLISNALKFTLEGKIEFGFSFSNEQQIEFYVSDTGIGIPKDKHEVIFERFIQLNTGTSIYSGGNGLGLAITKGLVKKLGGNIRLQSELEKGSTFYFTLKTLIYRDINSIDDSIIENIKPDCFLGKTILVVEDDRFNKELIYEILDNFGLNLIFTEKGLDSVRICLNTPIDIVLMDIGLPDISGYEAIKQILSNNSNIKIIAQTAYASPDDKNKALELGCIDYISKPLKENELIEILKKHL